MIPSTDTLLETHDLTIGYHDGHRENIILQHLNLSLNQGELVCFMGINGIGKSTLIRTLAGLQKPLSGAVTYTNRTAAGDLSKTASVVLTDRVAAPSMSVYDLISFGRYPYLNWTVRMNDVDREIIERAIQQVHIDHLRNKSIYELSDGQLQMAMIARALSQDSEVILLDEPTAHLDLNNRIEIMNLLRSISHSMKKAILIATHELDLALQAADLIWLAGEDRRIRAGIPEDLVLDGSFDEVFRFKGFDLKTGKLQQHPHRNYKIQLQGEGYQYRWTKNALERSGYSLAQVADCKIVVHVEGNTTTWVIEEEAEKVFKTIKDLLLFLSNKIPQNLF